MSTDRLWTTYYGFGGSGGLSPFSGVSVFDADTLAPISTMVAPTNSSSSDPYRLTSLDAAPDKSILYISAGGFDSTTPDLYGSGIFRYDPFGGGWVDLLGLPRLAQAVGGTSRPTQPDFVVTPDGLNLWVFYDTFDYAGTHGGAGAGLVEFAIPALPGSYSSSTRTALSGSPSTVLSTGYSAQNPVSSPPYVNARSCVFSPNGLTAYIRANGNLLGDGVRRDGIAVVTVATKALVRYILPVEPSASAYRTPRGFDVSGDGSRLHVAITHGGSDIWVHSFDTSTGAELAYYLVANAASTPMQGNNTTFLPVSCDPDPSSAGYLFASFKGGAADGRSAYINATGATRTTNAGNVYGDLGSRDAYPMRTRFRRGTSMVGVYVLMPWFDVSSTPSANTTNLLIQPSGSSVGSGFSSAYGTMDCFVLPASLIVTPTLSPQGFRRDATARPAFLTADGTGVSLRTSRDAGHTYNTYAVSASASTDPSLLTDPVTNTHRVVVTGPVSAGVATINIYEATKDGEQGDWGSATAITTLHGAYPACAQHPDDESRVAMLYLDGGALKVGMSGDYGRAASWAYLSTVVASGLSFTTSGRAALCWLGECLLAAWCDGSALKIKLSTDGGHTWPGSAVTVASGGPYYGSSAHAALGTLYLLTNTATASKVFRCGDLGATWAATATDPPAQTPGTALGFEAERARLLLGTTKYSADDGATWPSV